MGLKFETRNGHFDVSNVHPPSLFPTTRPPLPPLFETRLVDVDVIPVVGPPPVVVVPARVGRPALVVGPPGIVVRGRGAATAFDRGAARPPRVGPRSTRRAPSHGVAAWPTRPTASLPRLRAPPCLLPWRAWWPPSRRGPARRRLDSFVKTVPKILHHQNLPLRDGST